MGIEDGEDQFAAVDGRNLEDLADVSTLARSQGVVADRDLGSRTLDELMEFFELTRTHVVVLIGRPAVLG